MKKSKKEIRRRRRNSQRQASSHDNTSKKLFQISLVLSFVCLFFHFSYLDFSPALQFFISVISSGVACCIGPYSLRARWNGPESYSQRVLLRFLMWEEQKVNFRILPPTRFWGQVSLPFASSFSSSSPFFFFFFMVVSRGKFIAVFDCFTTRVSLPPFNSIVRSVLQSRLHLSRNDRACCYYF